MECRLCLSHESPISIWGSPESLVLRIWSCCQLQVEKDDGLPDQICSSCEGKLVMFSQFKNMCQQSNQILRSRINPVVNIKVEVVEVTHDDEDKLDSKANIKVEEVILSDDNCESEGCNVQDRNSFLFKLLSQTTKKNDAVVSVVKEMEEPYCKKTRIKCKMCSKAFMYRSHLNRHMLTHLGEKPFECDLCSKQFALKYNLSQHMKIHIGYRPHKCELCPGAFIQRCDLRDHMKIHTGEKPFKCEVCSKAFVHKCSLIRHVLVHGEEKQ